MSGAYAPPGWPGTVRPPSVPGWEETATGWLLDQCPPDFRVYPVLRRNPVVLARFTAIHLEAATLGVARGLSQTRTALRDVADAATVDQAILAWQHEEARLLALTRSVSLVEQALRGRRYVARL